MWHCYIQNVYQSNFALFFFLGGGELLYFLKMKYKEHIYIYPLLSLESFVECSDY